MEPNAMGSTMNNEFVGTHLVYFIDRLHTLMYISNFLFTLTHNLFIDSLLFVLVVDSQQFWE
jgi:hypothetical protein